MNFYPQYFNVYILNMAYIIMDLKYLTNLKDDILKTSVFMLYK